MNETQDGTEPLGEAPEVAGYFRALDNATALVTQARRDAQIIEKLRGLHDRGLTGAESYCMHCTDLGGRGGWVAWPCETMRIIEAVRL